MTISNCPTKWTLVTSLLVGAMFYQSQHSRIVQGMPLNGRTIRLNDLRVRILNSSLGESRNRDIESDTWEDYTTEQWTTWSTELPGETTFLEESITTEPPIETTWSTEPPEETTWSTEPPEETTFLETSTTTEPTWSTETPEEATTEPSTAFTTEYPTTPTTEHTTTETSLPTTTEFAPEPTTSNTEPPPELTTPSEELEFKNQLVGRDEAISYAFDQPFHGIDIEMDVRLGEVVGYYSYTHTEPDELNNDGVVDHSGGTYIPYRPPFAQVFVRIQGVLVENIYDMIVRLR